MNYEKTRVVFKKILLLITHFDFNGFKSYILPLSWMTHGVVSCPMTHVVANSKENRAVQCLCRRVQPKSILWTIWRCRERDTSQMSVIRVTQRCDTRDPKLYISKLWKVWQGHRRSLKLVERAAAGITSDRITAPIIKILCAHVPKMYLASDCCHSYRDWSSQSVCSTIGNLCAELISVCKYWNNFTRLLLSDWLTVSRQPWSVFLDLMGIY